MISTTDGQVSLSGTGIHSISSETLSYKTNQVPCWLINIHRFETNVIENNCEKSTKLGGSILSFIV